MPTKQFQTHHEIYDPTKKKQKVERKVYFAIVVELMLAQRK